MTNPEQPTPDAPAPQITIRHPAPDAPMPTEQGEHPYHEVSFGNALEQADPTEAPLPADDEV
ncbi:hypothetical protein [Deinococcus sp. QL22]|uniref:hypothetical protein n=1 Tax=Deinococcus sp. QL22 TaxID=2939437 RepID=UPI002017E3FE|nr:hypothetical protein [Deinococcus sp. QL22]UQN06566.1 hypothetical protein M1R55_01200 [Deinococcus sp. QL22]